MQTVASADKTPIAFDRLGEGPPLIMVAGAFNDRSTTAPLAGALQNDLAIFNYDRRGRGDSGDTSPYSVEREIEDIAALIEEAGGTAAVFGYSSGANLAVLAAGSGLEISKLALYEPPYRADPSYPALASDFLDRLTALIEQGRRGDAVELYQTEGVGIPPEVVAQMRHAPFRPALEALAHTLVYNGTIVGDRELPTDLLQSITTPTLVLCGEDTVPFLRAAATAVVDALPNGHLRLLERQGHEINPEATAPVLTEFLTA